MITKLKDYGLLDGLDVYAELTPWVSDVAKSKSVTALVDAIRDVPDDERNADAMGRAFLEGLIPIMIKEKREATMHIIAILSGERIEAVEAMSPPEFMAAVKQLGDDSDLFRFFTSYVSLARVK